MTLDILSVKAQEVRAKITSQLYYQNDIITNPTYGKSQPLTKKKMVFHPNDIDCSFSVPNPEETSPNEMSQSSTIKINLDAQQSPLKLSRRAQKSYMFTMDNATSPQFRKDPTKRTAPNSIKTNCKRRLRAENKNKYNPNNEIPAPGRLALPNKEILTRYRARKLASMAPYKRVWDKASSRTQFHAMRINHGVRGEREHAGNWIEAEWRWPRRGDEAVPDIIVTTPKGETRYLHDPEEGRMRTFVA
ncbi:hypothetical protein M406DRAFT_74632 [Cryphonectria parasitica EP155]|uniref:Uncharacterized protein n=1 Tax=Cryphonectria parasitica (strain ATCC 38755 / EP155) TaxID=660469 RepID=A0A9P5CK50_CRYP1|nr:uncharacterized protein M406DRAFT_74632 [Cryphonectria parasitica EP155]KAF3761688.1 hypothetical protein M406DRAFT_74632 [Cryphonectria parasitica EP155]